MADNGWEVAAVRRRRERLDRSPWQRFRHWVHAQAYPDLHRERCFKCREKLTPMTATAPDKTVCLRTTLQRAS